MESYEGLALEESGIIFFSMVLLSFLKLSIFSCLYFESYFHKLKAKPPDETEMMHVYSTVNLILYSDYIQYHLCGRDQQFYQIANDETDNI